MYRNELKNVSGIMLLENNPDRESSHWLFTMLVEKREDFIRALKDKGIPASVVHLRIDKNSIFGGIRRDLLNQERFNNKQVSIPIHAGLNDEEVQKIINTIKGGW
jgi:dTDP-4-amino-4,6-dideoxygalactose transaminase